MLEKVTERACPMSWAQVPGGFHPLPCPGLCVLPAVFISGNQCQGHLLGPSGLYM